MSWNTPTWSPNALSVSQKNVGRERVIASTDCGLGGRVHPAIAWAKLEALAKGAAVARPGSFGVSGVGN